MLRSRLMLIALGAVEGDVDTECGDEGTIQVDSEEGTQPPKLAPQQRPGERHKFGGADFGRDRQAG